MVFRVLPSLFALGLACAAVACAKHDRSTRAPKAEAGSTAAKPNDPDAIIPVIVTSMQRGDRKQMLDISVDPLIDDLSEIAFEDLAKVIQYLGEFEDFHEEENNDSLVARQRKYVLEFKRGEVELTVTVYPDGGLVGFHFSGDDFVAAEHGALEDRYRQFKVYDFAFLGPGNRKLQTEVLKRGEIKYQVIVGGLEAKRGEHHLTVEKIVLNDSGTEVVHEGGEFDLNFEENAEGIPRGQFRGIVELTKPGKYKLKLVIRDNVSKRQIEFERPFVIQ